MSNRGSRRIIGNVRFWLLLVFATIVAVAIVEGLTLKKIGFGPIIIEFFPSSTASPQLSPALTPSTSGPIETVAPLSTTSPATVPAGLPCPPFGQPGVKEAVLVGLAVPPTLSISPAYYKAVVADNLQLEFGVRLTGVTPPHTKLYVIEQVGPTRNVTTHPRSPGTGRYYRYDKETSLDLDDNAEFSGGCYIRKYAPAYKNKPDGITFRQWFILVNESKDLDFFNLKPEGGYSDADLDSLDVTRLAYFDVPTD